MAGSTASSVPDVLAPGLTCIFCGINPGRVSAEAAAHFANTRNDFWRLLHYAGFTPRLLDAISGTGELLAAPLVAAAIRAAGRGSSPIPATELIVTTEQFGGAEPLADATEAKTLERLRPLIDRGEIPVVTGFIGATADGVLTTLGRGGSDYSASIIGAALSAAATWDWISLAWEICMNLNCITTYAIFHYCRNFRHL